jgi:hypothetical protein
MEFPAVASLRDPEAMPKETTSFGIIHMHLPLFLFTQLLPLTLFLSLCPEWCYSGRFLFGIPKHFYSGLCIREGRG